MICFSISTSRSESCECQDLRSSTIELFRPRSIASRGHYCTKFCRSWTDAWNMPPRPPPGFPSKTHNAPLPNTHNGSKHIHIHTAVQSLGRGLGLPQVTAGNKKRANQIQKRDGITVVSMQKCNWKKYFFIRRQTNEPHLCRLFILQKTEMESDHIRRKRFRDPCLFLQT